jgi:4-amino-4-deoxy-L-arabinose transferase-like glycosyltransferase
VPNTPPASRGLVALLLVLFCVLWFGNLDTRRLIRPDEGRYAEIAREMAVSGDWITPRLNGGKYFEKPPLQYWATAAAYRAFGRHAWTARLWPALSGALCVLLAWRLGRRLFGARAGDFAGIACASMLWPVANGHLNTLDMGLTLFLTAAVGATLWAQTTDQPASRRRRMWLAWAACGGAVLSKGLVGIVLPGGAVAAYLAASRDWRLLARLHLPSGLAILLGVTAPWFVAVSLANPEFAQFFFIHEHFQRYLTSSHRRVQPWWFFLPLLVAGTLPWTVLAGQSVLRSLRHDPSSPGFRPRLFLLCWIGFVVLFFSASGSKLPSYILPVVPALAWLMGDTLARLPAGALRWHALPLLPLALAAALLATRAERFANERTPAALYQAFEPWILAAAAAIAVAAVLCLWWERQGRRALAVVAMGIGGLAAWQAVLTGHDALSPSFSSARFVESLPEQLRSDCPLYSVRAYDQTLPFYLGRTVTLVEFADEMQFGLEQEPALGVPNIGLFMERWRTQSCAYAYMEPATHTELAAAGLPMRLIARDTRRVLVAHPAMEPLPLP